MSKLSPVIQSSSPVIRCDLDRHVHANSKHRMLITCRVYLAKRSTDEAIFPQFEGI